MMNAKHSLLFCMTLIAISSCQSVPTNYFKRPNINETINNNCTGFNNGRLIDATNFISVNAEDYATLSEYLDAIELRLYTCLKYPKRCK